jgi:hypothetical protein
VFGAKDNLAIVAHAEKVEGYRLGPYPENRRTYHEALSKYPVSSGPQVVEPSIARGISDTLASPDTYMLDARPACTPRYGVWLAFHRGKDRVDMLLCLECAELPVYRDNSEVGDGNFYYWRAALVRAVKAIYPWDEANQALREKWGQ